MMIADKVEDEEVLYRSVPNGCFTIADGALRLTSTAFNETARKSPPLIEPSYVVLIPRTPGKDQRMALYPSQHVLFAR